GKPAGPLVVLEVAARDPEHDAPVDDVGHMSREWREQFFVDGQRDVHAGGDAGERGRLFEKGGDLADVVRNEREGIRSDGDRGHEPWADVWSAAVAASAISRACSVDSRASAASESFSSSVNPARRRKSRAS